MTDIVSNIEWLQDWYHSQSDGKWEHFYGLKIDTLDNPGWSIDVDLTGTDLENGKLPPISDERSETDWIWCAIENRVFKGRGGPTNLDELIGEFRKWATSHVRGVRGQ